MIDHVLPKRLLWWAALCVAGVPIHAAMAQQLGQGTDAADLTGWRILATLLFLGLLVAGAIFALRNSKSAIPFFRSADERRVRMLETIRISPQTQLCLLAFEGREYLIAFTAQGASVIETRTFDQNAGEP